jgi:RHS repeat-associated protein
LDQFSGSTATDAQHEYTYDRSGNRLSRHLNSEDHRLIDSLTYTGNLIAQMFDDQGVKTFAYDANGSLGQDDRRGYQYNSLGQLTALGYAVEWAPCRYDAMGRRVLRCPGVGGLFPPEIWAGYDGQHLIRFKDAAATQPVWRFVHGPGLDDALVAVKRDLGTENYAKHYYLTDGQGREYAFTDAQGNDFTQNVAYWQNGGNQSGAVGRAITFDNQRATSGIAPDISFYRNRYYDQKTGRWTQEDPIGIAGGVNLYLYVGNNPATLGDPFGLCPKDVGGDGNTESVDDCPEWVIRRWERSHIMFRAGTNWTDVDPAIRRAVILASMDLRKDLFIYSGLESGHSVEGRHGEGGAVDISRINGVRFTLMSDAASAGWGNLLGAMIANRLPCGRVRMVYTPGMAFRFNRPMNLDENRRLIASHLDHVHVTVDPREEEGGCE